MIQKSKIRKSWYASSGLTKNDWYEQAIAKHAERQNANWSKWNEPVMHFECREKAEKHQKKVYNTICFLLKKHYRTAADAAHTPSKWAKLRTGTPAIWTDYDLDWNMYSKQYGHPGKKYYTYVRLPVLFDLPPVNLRAFDNIINLKCEFVKRKNNISFYNALWVSQERGYNVSLQSGFIAVDWTRNISFHADTTENAEKGLIRKIKRQTQPKEKSYSEWKSTDYITRKKFHQLTGACMEGIEQFCHRARIEDKKRMQIKDIIPLLKKYASSYYDKIAEHAPQLIDN